MNPGCGFLSGNVRNASPWFQLISQVRIVKANPRFSRPRPGYSFRDCVLSQSFLVPQASLKSGRHCHFLECLVTLLPKNLGGLNLTFGFKSNQNKVCGGFCGCELFTDAFADGAWPRNKNRYIGAQNSGPVSYKKRLRHGQAAR